jgi:hypothetical protein
MLVIAYDILVLVNKQKVLIICSRSLLDSDASLLHFDNKLPVMICNSLC